MIMMDFLRYKKKGKRIFVTCPRVTKLIINEQDVIARKSKGVAYTPPKLYENKRRA